MSTLQLSAPRKALSRAAEYARAINLRKRLRAPLVVFVFAALGYGAWGQLPFPQIEGEYFQSGNAKLHYTIQGEGEPVILLHGFAMNQDISWRRPGVIDRLDDHFQVIALDQRGHGLSEKPHEASDYGIEMARDVIRLMDHLGIQRAHIAGTSMGAIVALRVMASYPDRVISAAPCAMGWPRPHGPNMTAIVGLANSLDNGGGFDPLFTRLHPEHNPSTFTLTAVNMVVGYINDKHALAAVARALTELSVTREELKRVPVPVLTAIGEFDPLRADLGDMDGLVQRHEVKVLEGVNHFGVAPSTEFQDSLLDFLQRNTELPAAQSS